MSFEAGKDSIETEFPDGTYYLHRPLTNESPLGVSRDEDGFVGAGEGGLPVGSACCVAGMCSCAFHGAGGAPRQAQVQAVGTGSHSRRQETFPFLPAGMASHSRRQYV
jgi:hypothetical protein